MLLKYNPDAVLITELNVCKRHAMTCAMYLIFLFGKYLIFPSKNKSSIMRSQHSYS